MARIHLCEHLDALVVVMEMRKRMPLMIPKVYPRGHHDGGVCCFLPRYWTFDGHQ